jgi:hypothetical protein
MRFVILPIFFALGRSADVQITVSTTIEPTASESPTAQTTTAVAIDSTVVIVHNGDEELDDTSVDASASNTADAGGNSASVDASASNTADAGGKTSETALGGEVEEEDDDDSNSERSESSESEEEDNDDSNSESSESSESSGFTSSDDEDEPAVTTIFKFDDKLVKQCTADDKALWSGSDDFSRKIAIAATKGAGMEFRVKPLIQQAYATLSEPCVDCFTKAASCGAYWCMFSGCMSDSFSKNCITCIDWYCTKGTQRCIGATDEEMPPRPPITDADDQTGLVSATSYVGPVLFVGLPLLAAFIAYAYRK